MTRRDANSGQDSGSACAGAAGVPAEPVANGQTGLLEPAFRYDLFHAIRLLETAVPGAVPLGGAGPARLEALRLRPSTELSFPVNVIEALEALSGPGANPLRPLKTLTLRLPALYGARSPLPSSYGQDVLDGEEHAPHLRDFLDLFHHRLYSLLHRGKRRSRADLGLEPGGTDLRTRSLLSLIGLSPETPEASIGMPPLRTLHYLGYLLLPSRPPRGLEVLLEDELHIPVRVLPAPLRTVRVPEAQRFPISSTPGEGGRLGRNLLVGELVPDRRGTVHLELGPLSLKDYQALQPEQPAGIRLIGMTRFYLRRPLAMRLTYLLPGDQVPGLRIGGEQPGRLGQVATLGDCTSDLCRLSIDLPLSFEPAVEAPAQAPQPASQRPLEEDPR